MTRAGSRGDKGPRSRLCEGRRRAEGPTVPARGMEQLARFVRLGRGQPGRKRAWPLLLLSMSSGVGSPHAQGHQGQGRACPGGRSDPRARGSRFAYLLPVELNGPSDITVPYPLLWSQGVRHIRDHAGPQRTRPGPPLLADALRKPSIGFGPTQLHRCGASGAAWPLAGTERGPHEVAPTFPCGVRGPLREVTAGKADGNENVPFLSNEGPRAG